MKEHTNTQRENLAMKIMLKRSNQLDKLISFEDALKDSVKLIEDFENQLKEKNS